MACRPKMPRCKRASTLAAGRATISRRARAQLEAPRPSRSTEPRTATCEPDYYGQEQALFLDLFAHGLVTRKESYVERDLVDMTVLANEQVIDGRGWRSARWSRRRLPAVVPEDHRLRRRTARRPQEPDHCLDKVWLMQENWIGKSQVLEFSFAGGWRRASTSSRRARHAVPGPALRRFRPTIRWSAGQKTRRALPRLVEEAPPS